MNPRRLTSVPAARWLWLPVALRRSAARTEMRRRSTEELADRLAMLPYAACLRPGSPPGSGAVGSTIWQYWGAGAATAPPLVRTCLHSVRQHASDHAVVVLDDDTVSAHVELPSWIVDRRQGMGPTHFSDVLRVALLAEHGGTWADATVYLTAPIPDDLRTLPFFAFTRLDGPWIVSSWFLRAVPGHPLVVALRDMLFDYWRTATEPHLYFQLHAMFEAAVVYHRRLRQAWEATPVRDFRDPHLLQSLLLQPFTADQLAAAEATSWIHKLSWKVDGSGGVTTGTFLDHLERAGP